MTTPSLAVIILTLNEEKHIARAIGSVAGIAREIVVVDSGSTDRTAEIAEGLGARVVEHAFVSHARQFNWALDEIELSSDWIMRLDADEIIEPDLAQTLVARLSALPADVAGVQLKRKHIFLGRWIRHGGRYPVELVRIWRKGAGRVEDRWMDEHVLVTGGRIVTVEGGFADHNLGDLTAFVAKHNDYATREAIEIVDRRRGLLQRAPEPAGLGPAQAERKRRLKRVYERLPFPITALVYFFYRYFIRLGFLDGTPGLIYHALQGGWYRFLVGAKAHEFERRLAHMNSSHEALDELARVTGLKLR